MHRYGRPMRSVSNIKKTRPFKCPVCGQKKMFILLIGEQAGKLKQCKNCDYKHLDDTSNSE